MTKEDIKRIIKEHKDILEKYRVKSVALFGSYVRNEQKEDSDIDLLVEFEQPSYDNFIHFIFSLEDLLKKEVTVVTPKGISPYILPYVLKEVEEIARR
jgi:hypothetical protein